MRRAGLLAALVACLSCRGRAPAADAAPFVTEAPPPSRPTDALAVAHLGRPRATFETLGEALGANRPPDLVLVAALGLDVAVVAAVDTTRPVDVVALGGAHPGYALALTPAGAAHARSLLATRYRFTHVDGLGERVAPRGDPGLSSPEHRVPCALVRVPSTISSRVVCASDEAALLAAGRWIAYESASRAELRTDFEATLDGRGARGAGEALRAVIAATQQRLLAEASAARREHDRPPDYGDPEALVTELGGITEELSSALSAVRRATLRADVSRERVELSVDLALPADGATLLSADARDRSAVPLEHPMAALLPADAVFMLGDRAPAASRAETLRRITASAIRVLGDRVTLASAARTDLDALVSHTGDDLALAVARDAPEGLEVSLALSQTDSGAGARAALSRIAAAPWLRGLRVGAAPSVTAIRDGVVITRAATGTPGTLSPPSLAMGVRAGALVMVLGRHAQASLDASSLRASGPAPALLGSLRASVAGALDLASLGLRVSSPVSFTWGAQPAEGGLSATLRVTAPTAALALALRGAMQPR